MLVAASLAPPAGLVGMASAIGRWDMVISGLFVLLLQLVGINLTAAILFRIFGLSTQGSRYNRGKKWVFLATLAVSVTAIAGLLTWQLTNPPHLQRSSLAQRATAEIQEVVNESNLVEPVEVNVRFTRAKIKSQNTLLGVVYVQRQAGITISSEEICEHITSTIQTHLLQQGFNATPLINVNVLKPPTSINAGS